MANEINNDLMRLERMSLIGLSEAARKLHAELIEDLCCEHVAASDPLMMAAGL